MDQTPAGAPVTIGRHRIVCGDVMHGGVGRLMAGERAQVVYSDPPWGDAILKFFYRHASLDAGDLTWSAFIARWVADVRAHLADDGVVFVEMGNSWSLELGERLLAAGFRFMRELSVSYRSGSSFLPSTLLVASTAAENLPPVHGGDVAGLHGAALPRACLAAVADRYPGGIVLDPCCGKGFTARAAAELGFAFRGLELNPTRLAVTESILRRAERRHGGAR